MALTLLWSLCLHRVFHFSQVGQGADCRRLHQIRMLVAKTVCHVFLPRTITFLLLCTSVSFNFQPSPGTSYNQLCIGCARVSLESNMFYFPSITSWEETGGENDLVWDNNNNNSTRHEKSPEITGIFQFWWLRSCLPTQPSVLRWKNAKVKNAWKLGIASLTFTRLDLTFTNFLTS